MKVIAFDLDETLINLIDEVKKLFKKYYSKYYPSKDWMFSNYTPFIRNKIFNLFENKDIMCNLKPYRKTIKLIKKLKKQGHKILVITARNNKIKNETVDYVKKLFNVDCIVVPPNTSKLKTMKKHNVQIWFDDFPMYLLKYQKAGIKCIMISNKNTAYNHYLRNQVIWYKDIKSVYKNINKILNYD